MNDTFTFDDRTHTYRLNGDRMTGVTTVIGVLAKPALIGWAAKMAVEYITQNGHRALLVSCNDDENYEESQKHSWFGDSDKVRLDPRILHEVIQEAKNAHTKKKEAAGEHGTDAHALVEGYINICLEKGGSPNGADGFGGGETIKQFIAWSIENVDHFLFSERRMFDKELFIAGTADFAYIGKDGKKYMADFKTSGGVYGIDYFLQVAAYKMLAEGQGDEPYDGMTIVRLGKKGDFEVQKLYEYETYRDAFLACLKLYRAQASIQGMVVKD